MPRHVESRVESGRSPGLTYLVYRSETPTFPPATEMSSYAISPPGMTVFCDVDLVPGITYYYQVRAYAGQAGPPPPVELLSAPTNTASATQSNRAPVARNDVTSTMEDQLVSISVLFNDTDPDGDPLVIESVGQPQPGAAVVNPDRTVSYTPEPDYFGPPRSSRGSAHPSSVRPASRDCSSP